MKKHCLKIKEYLNKWRKNPMSLDWKTIVLRFAKEFLDRISKA